MLEEIKKILRLSFSLAKTQFKLRNEGSYLGIFWYLLNPLAMFFIILAMSGAITRTDIKNYPIYLLLGLIMFNFFRQATSGAIYSVSSNGNFIKSMKVSSESFVVSSLFLSTCSHFFEIIILIGFILFFKIPIIGVIFYPVIFFILFLFTLGVSFILAVLGAYISDFYNIWDVFMNLLWFSTPIFYILLPNNITILQKLNPMYYFISISRDIIIYGNAPSANIIETAIISALVILLVGIIIFKKFKSKFAELV